VAAIYWRDPDSVKDTAQELRCLAALTTLARESLKCHHPRGQ
jgi:hypothetical protein